MKYTNFDQLPLALNITELASALGVSRKSAYLIVSRNLIKSFKVGKHIRVPKDEVIRYMCGN